MYRLTSCNARGPYGPTLADCEEAYKGQQMHHGNHGNNAATLIDVNEHGLQKIYLPTGGSYRITGNKIVPHYR